MLLLGTSLSLPATVRIAAKGRIIWKVEVGGSVIIFRLQPCEPQIYCTTVYNREKAKNCVLDLKHGGHVGGFHRAEASNNTHLYYKVRASVLLYMEEGKIKSPEFGIHVDL